MAVDHDPQAVLATRANAERNGVAERLEVVHSSDFAPQQADIVLANILANILVELAPTLASLVNANGWLIMSGILQNQAAGVVEAYRNSLDFEAPVGKKDWVRLDGRRQKH